MDSYGIISDMHSADPSLVYKMMEAFKKRNVKGVILNGDIVGERTSLTREEYLAEILFFLDKLNLEAYVQTGSHEILDNYIFAIDFAKKELDSENIHFTALENSKIEGNGYEIVFLPGSDWHVGKAVNFGFYLNNNLETGIYEVGKHTINHGYIYSKNVGDLEKIIDDPQSTVVVSHVPAKFDFKKDIEKSVDFAHYVETLVVSTHLINFEHFDKDLIFTTLGVSPANGFIGQKGIPYIEYSPEINDINLAAVSQRIAKTLGQDRIVLYVERKEHRGNKDLQELFNKLEIKKGVSGHFHEAAGNAHDLKGRIIPPNEWTDELFWNASYADKGKAGILYLREDGKVKYENLQF
jgi:Icc-related predicted phosphoesterase